MTGTPPKPTTEPNPKGTPMTDRGKQLRATAAGQIAELIALTSTVEQAALRLPCPGREKLGDGTVGAGVRHTADTFDLGAVLEQLSASRDTLGPIAELADSQLDAIPPDGSFRFCDGQRSLAQVLASLFKHQGHQVDAIRSAVA